MYHCRALWIHHVHYQHITCWNPPLSWLGYRGWNMHTSGSLFQSAACVLLLFWETAPSFSSLRQNLPCMSPCTISFPCCLCLTLAYPFPLFPLCWGSSYLKLLKSLQMPALLSNSSSMDSQHWTPVLLIMSFDRFLAIHNPEIQLHSYNSQSCPNWNCMFF